MTEALAGTDARAGGRLPQPGVTLSEAFRVWLRVAMLSFGGPAGQIAVMHRILVEEKRWISEGRFLHALNYCMLLPGPEAQQLATYVGWLMHKTRGGLLAGGLFILPGVIAIMTLSYVYAAFGHVGLVTSLFFGLKAAVLAIVLQAVFRIGSRALQNATMIALAALAFVAIFFFRVPFPVIVFGAALVGFVGDRAGLTVFRTAVHGNGAGKEDGFVDDLLGGEVPDHVRPTLARTLGVTAVWLPLWLGPVIVLLIMLVAIDLLGLVCRSRLASRAIGRRRPPTIDDEFIEIGAQIPHAATDLAKGKSRSSPAPVRKRVRA